MCANSNTPFCGFISFVVVFGHIIVLPAMLLSLHYYRIVSYTKMLGRRYRLINEHIADIVAGRRDLGTTESDDECMRIVRLRHIYRQLLATSKSASALFRCSHATTMFNEFVTYSLFTYFWWAMSADSAKEVLAAVRIGLRAVQLILFASACESVAQEVGHDGVTTKMTTMMTKKSIWASIFVLVSSSIRQAWSWPHQGLKATSTLKLKMIHSVSVL